MHPAIRDATGCALLLSSIVALAILLRTGCKHQKKSPFYILSVSDVFSTILTAVALLLGRTEADAKLIYDQRNGTTGDPPDRTWTINDEGKYQFLLSQSRDAGTDKTDSNSTLTCDTISNVFMQYGMLLAPLTNALVSLLTFTVQCNLDAAYARRRCATRSPVERPESKCSAEVTHREEAGTSRDERDNGAKNTSSDDTREITRVTLSRKEGEDKRPAGVLVIGHWLLPFLVVATLYTAEYTSDVSDVVRRPEDTECVFESNFPMSDFYGFSHPDDNPQFVDSAGVLENDYFVMRGSPDSNSTEVNRIVSKVQDIVKVLLDKNARNFTVSSAANPADGRIRPRNVTEYIVRSNAVQIEGNASLDGEIRRTSNALEARNDDMSKRSDATTARSGVAQQTSIRSKGDDYREDARIANTEESADSRRIIGDAAIAQNATFVSGGKGIHIDVIRRVRAATRSRYNRSVDRYYDGRRPKRNVRIARRKPSSIKDLLYGGNNFNRNAVRSDLPPHVADECLVSTRFLKLHLSTLFFAIYLLPILLCCILQVRADRVCKSTLAMLRAKADLASTSRRSDPKEDDEATLVDKPRSKWPFTNGKRQIRNRISSEELDAIQEIKDSDTSKMDIEATGKNHENCTEIQGKDKLLEVGYVTRTFRVVNLSLLLCVVLWTPIFLGTLLRVLLCIRAPQWLIDITLLGALSFGVVRNILNVNIIKIQKLCGNASARENRIHPVE